MFKRCLEVALLNSVKTRKKNPKKIISSGPEPTYFPQKLSALLSTKHNFTANIKWMDISGNKWVITYYKQTQDP